MVAKSKMDLIKEGKIKAGQPTVSFSQPSQNRSPDITPEFMDKEDAALAERWFTADDASTIRSRIKQASEKWVADKDIVERLKPLFPDQEAPTPDATKMDLTNSIKVEWPDRIDPETGEVFYDKKTDAWEDKILSAEELWGAEKAVYDQLSDAEKKQFELIGEEARRQGQDYVKAQLDYLSAWKRAQEFLTTRREKQVEQQNIGEMVTRAQVSDRLKQAEQQVQNLKQNVGYLGSLGRLWVSQQSLDAQAKIVSDAQAAYTQMKRLEWMLQQSRKLWFEIDADAFERQMSDLQRDLNENVNLAIQVALEELNSAEIEERYDTRDELEDFRMILLNNLDESIAWISDANYEQRKFLLEKADQIIAEEEKRLEEQKQEAVNYVDTFINTWLSRSYNEILDQLNNWFIDQNQAERAKASMINNTMWWLQEQVWADAAQFQDQVSQWIEQGRTPYEILNDITQDKTFKAAMVWTWDKPKYMNLWDWVVLKTNPDWTEEFINKPWSTWVLPTNPSQSDSLKQISYTDTTTVQTTLTDFFTTYNEPQKYWQCGRFVNDYLLKMWVNRNGARIFTDPVSLKKQYANSTVPTIGSVAIMDSEFAPEYWHVAIVTGINADWTIDVLESNRDGKEMTSTWTYNIDDMYGFFDPTLKPEQAWWVDQSFKEAILSAVRTWNLTNTQKDAYRKQARQEWRIDEYVKAESTKYDWEKVIKLKENVIKSQSYKDMLDITRWFDTVQGIYGQWVENASWFEDIAAINALQRMIDPGATVREWDVELVQSAIPYFKRIDPEFKWNKFSGWDVLPAETRQKLIETAESIYQAQAKWFNETIEKQRWSNFERAGSDIYAEWITFDVKQDQWQWYKWQYGDFVNQELWVAADGQPLDDVYMD